MDFSLISPTLHALCIDVHFYGTLKNFSEMWKKLREGGQMEEGLWPSPLPPAASSSAFL
jgi:hypothetical protein